MGVGKYRDEAGYTLLYTLGAILMVSLVVGAIFILAQTTFSQVERVDLLKRSDDVKEYGLQEASRRIDEKITQAITDLGQTDFDLKNDFEQRVCEKAQQVLSEFQISETDIGSKQRFSYEVKLVDTITSQKILPQILDEGLGSNGWQQSTVYLANVTNVQLAIALQVKVAEKKAASDEVVERTTNCQYIYELQGEQAEVSATTTGLDIWRNVFYSYYLPTNTQGISADEWLRKIDHIYRYQNEPVVFDYENYTNDGQTSIGQVDGRQLDYTDDRLLDFTTGNKTINQLQVANSFLMEHGAQLVGKNSRTLQVDNLLAIRNHQTATPLNYLQSLSVQAGVGMYVDLASPGTKLIIDETEITTSNLLINASNTELKGSSQSSGVLLSAGTIQVGSLPNASNYSFSGYQNNATDQTPKDASWSSFMDGGLVIASSNLYAGPVSEGKDFHSEQTTARKIVVDGNFMLTNAKLSSATGANDMSYFAESQSQFIYPNSPSRLTLSGENTSFKVTGYSFFDAPKQARRKALSEMSPTELFTGYYPDSNYWNKVSIQEGANMELDYTGTEPFHLEVGKQSYLSFKTLPNLALFDPTFIKECVSRGNLGGKMIIQPFNQADAQQLADLLKDQGLGKRLVEVNNLSEATSAADGKIIIVKPTNTTTESANFIISRRFSYIKAIN